MKKYVSKIMLVLSYASLIGAILQMVYLRFGGILFEFHRYPADNCLWVALIVSFGLFLGLYKIIDLLESN
ncbi:hypothetical protein DW1_1176 [Proteiniborus sp. DW1]|uniref:hypothetical protein n=1 Tax=Proteiniborus sp. DW1 TaxID=1889883 RepID=UPI00092E023C|nr:hypothetical protein [Proteiniborus sp. DW1]SCG82749.1 hypothetical protein DW1_1176 [Proteiniborus sp. DW1]